MTKTQIKAKKRSAGAMLFAFAASALATWAILALVGCATPQARPAPAAIDTSHESAPATAVQQAQQPQQLTPEQQYIQRVNRVVVWFETVVLPQLQKQLAEQQAKEQERKAIEEAKLKVLAERELAAEKAKKPEEAAKPDAAK